MATNFEFIKRVSAIDVNSVDITDCFTDKYSVYEVHFKTNNASNSTNIDMRLLDNTNTAVTTTTYQMAGEDFNWSAGYSEVRRSNDTGWLNVGAVSSDVGEGATGTIRIYNPQDSGQHTFATSEMSGWNTTSTARGRKNSYVEETAQQYKGMQFFIVANASYTTDIEIIVYGVKQ